MAFPFFPVAVCLKQWVRFGGSCGSWFQWRRKAVEIVLLNWIKMFLFYSWLVGIGIGQMLHWATSANNLMFALVQLQVVTLKCWRAGRWKRPRLIPFIFCIYISICTYFIPPFTNMWGFWVGGWGLGIFVFIDILFCVVWRFVNNWLEHVYNMYISSSHNVKQHRQNNGNDNLLYHYSLWLKNKTCACCTEHCYR